MVKISKLIIAGGGNQCCFLCSLLGANSESFWGETEDSRGRFIGASLERGDHMIEVGFELASAQREQIVVDGDDGQLEF